MAVPPTAPSGLAPAAAPATRRPPETSRRRRERRERAELRIIARLIKLAAGQDRHHSTASPLVAVVRHFVEKAGSKLGGKAPTDGECDETDDYDPAADEAYDGIVYGTRRAPPWFAPLSAGVEATGGLAPAHFKQDIHGHTDLKVNIPQDLGSQDEQAPYDIDGTAQDGVECPAGCGRGPKKGSIDNAPTDAGGDRTRPAEVDAPGNPAYGKKPTPPASVALVARASQAWPNDMPNIGAQPREVSDLFVGNCGQVAKQAKEVSDLFNDT